GLRPVVLTSSVGALAAALLVTVGYRDGPFPFASRPFSWGHVRDVVQVREWRLATGGYLGHMFELYSFWTWIPAFLAASVAAHAGVENTGRYAGAVSLATFLSIAVGGAGCIWGGLMADKSGRERLVMRALAASGT